MRELGSWGGAIEEAGGCAQFFSADAMDRASLRGAHEAVGAALGAPTVLVNAAVDALSDYGVTHLEMPVTPERIWRAIGARS